MEAQETQHGIVEAPVEVAKIRQVYNFLSIIYFLATPLEKKARLRGIELGRINPNDKILEVATGLGHSFLALLELADSANTVYGVDLSPAMLEKTRRLALKKGYEL